MCRHFRELPRFPHKANRYAPKWGVSRVAPLLFLLINGAQSRAENGGAEGIYQALTGSDLSQAAWLKGFGLKAGGWADAGFTYNPADPPNGSNAPVSFNFRANEWNLQQLDLFAEKPVEEDAEGWAAGGRFDFMFGTDAPYTQASGRWDSRLVGGEVFRFYKIALPQAYVDVRAPLGNGLSVRLGHFYSIIGYESVAAPPNFFYSHSYSMKSSPFTHTGVLLSYPVREDFTFYSGAVSGPDNFDSQFGAWSYLGGFNWKPGQLDAELSFSVLAGDTRETVDDNLTYCSLVLQHNIAGNLHYVLQHDHGIQAHVAKNGGMAGWYSIVQYLTWQAAETWGIGVRGEWFRDQNGTRYGIPGTGYYAATAGFNWKPLGWLGVRPEVRYDWADGPVKAYGGGQKNHQWLLGADFFVRF